MSYFRNQEAVQAQSSKLLLVFVSQDFAYHVYFGGGGGGGREYNDLSCLLISLLL